MKVQEIKNTNEKELPICAYGCNKKAHYLIGTIKKPCCSSHFSKCPAVVKISVQHGKATKKERYGDENYNNSQQRGETNQLRYGNTCSLHGDEPAKKTKQTWLEKYGSENRLDSEIGQKQMQQGMFNKHGVYNAFQIPTIVERIQQQNAQHCKEIVAKSLKTKQNTPIEIKLARKKKKQLKTRQNQYEQLLNNRFVAPLFSLDEFEKVDDIYHTLFKWKCLLCNKEFEACYTRFILSKAVLEQLNESYDVKQHVLHARCLDCFPAAKSDGISIEELQLYEFIKSIYNGKIVQSKHILKNSAIKGSHGLQIDIFLPDLNLGIEYNGVYFHSTKLVPKQYHLTKTILAEQQGIKLIHIRSDQWLNNSSQIKILLEKIILGTIKLDELYTNDIEYVDRSIFNKCFSIPNYILIGETATNIFTVKLDRTHGYEYEDSGYLIYKRM